MKRCFLKFCTIGLIFSGSVYSMHQAGVDIAARSALSTASRMHGSGVSMVDAGPRVTAPRATVNSDMMHSVAAGSVDGHMGQKSWYTGPTHFRPMPTVTTAAPSVEFDGNESRFAASGDVALGVRKPGMLSGGLFKATRPNLAAARSAGYPSLVAPKNLQEARDILGLAPNASSEKDILKAYKQKTLIYHPDVGGSHQDFVILQNARDMLLSGETLSSADARASSDFWGFRDWESRHQPPKYYYEKNEFPDSKAWQDAAVKKHDPLEFEELMSPWFRSKLAATGFLGEQAVVSSIDAAVLDSWLQGLNPDNSHKRQYFHNTEELIEVIERADRIFDTMDWDWYAQKQGKDPAELKKIASALRSDKLDQVLKKLSKHYIDRKGLPPYLLLKEALKLKIKGKGDLANKIVSAVTSAFKAHRERNK